MLGLICEVKDMMDGNKIERLVWVRQLVHVSMSDTAVFERRVI